jgi:hypothetical protein
MKTFAEIGALSQRSVTGYVNDDYLVFSCDGGDTWSEVVRFLSAVPTTQYMSVREISPGAYDDSIWAPGVGRVFRSK